jgi:3-hydroxybutyryl-CoA dehydrogenase
MVGNSENWLRKVHNIAVVGSGTMGHGIALVFARGGYDVTLYDINDAILQNGIALIDSHLDSFIENGLATKAAKQRTLSRIETTTDLASAVSEANIVLEAVSEILSVKQEIFHDVEEVCRHDTILASNTATFVISEIGALCQRQDNLIIAHWFNPPYIVPLVEVVKGPKTSVETMEHTYALLDKVGKKPVRIMKEIAGFVANRMQYALFREAFSILEKGVASVEDIDTVIKTSFGFRQPNLGIFEQLDLANLDQVIRESEEMLPKIDNSTEVPQTLKKLVDEGKFGAKAGEGFYKWPKEKLEATIKERDKQFLQRLKQLYFDKE